MENTNLAEDGCTDFHTAIEVENALPITEYFSTRIEKRMRCKSDFTSNTDFEIECSKDHWSQLRPTDSTDSESSLDDNTMKTNLEVFEDLRKHPEWGKFFKLFGERLVVGAKLAEGGQAEIFEAVLHGGDGSLDEKWVLKVFKEGSFLRDLQNQWPRGFLRSTQCVGTDVFLIRECVPMLGATLLQDERFAFLIQKCWGDLRKLIDMNMETNRNCKPPFSDAVAWEFMSDIAVGMRGLHHDGIVHRDLKAANVLIEVVHGSTMAVHIADFESSVGVVGTGFWRAPEILLALRNREVVPALFTEKTDVYSYAMTCYEILTGHIPFEGEKASNYDLVLGGQRPHLPDALDSSSLNCKVKALIRRCWHDNPDERPTFKEILQFWDEVLEPHSYRLRRVQKLLKML